MHQKVIDFVINTDFSASRTSDSKNISQVAAYAVQVEIGTASGLSGTLKLQGTNVDGSGWTDITNATVSYTTVSASQNWLYNVDTPAYMFVRLVWTRSAGTGTCSIANISTKAV